MQAGNKGLTKLKFLILNFTFCNGNNLHRLFNPLGSHNIILEIFPTLFKITIQSIPWIYVVYYRVYWLISQIHNQVLCFLSFRFMESLHLYSIEGSLVLHLIAIQLLIMIVFYDNVI